MPFSKLVAGDERCLTLAERLELRWSGPAQGAFMNASER
jgi:hypothetical protein